MFLSPADRVRLNSIRMEIDRIQFDIENNQIDHDIPICVICYDNLRSPKQFVFLACGHIHCQSCIDHIIVANVARREELIRLGLQERIDDCCATCRLAFNDDNMHRIFFNYKD